MTHSTTHIALMDQFPDFQTQGFDMEKYNSKFLQANFIINAKAKQIDFKKHWGCLSVKCAFQGNEFYECNGGSYLVNESSFLILNEGTYYSSFIDSRSEVESFTINFTPRFESEAYQALTSHTDFLLTNVDSFSKNNKLFFTEKLYSHGGTLSLIINNIKTLSENWFTTQDLILEQYLLVYESLMNNEIETQKTIENVAAVRKATRKELFVRLNRGKDFILSNYRHNLTLEEIADVSCLNQYYFLRQFKKMFNHTPHQFLQYRRIQEAATLLRKSDCRVTEVCNEVGFSDLASFSKLFKRYYGQSPIEFRGRKHGKSLV